MLEIITALLIFLALQLILVTLIVLAKKSSSRVEKLPF